MAFLRKQPYQSELEEGLLSKENTSSTPPKSLSNAKWQVLALVLSVQANAYIMMSILPYIAFMCIDLVPGLTEQNAGSYAGAASTVSSLGKLCTAYAWSMIADKYGRKTALYGSYFLTIIFTVAFGFSSSITMLFLTRFLLGASNSNMVVVKTLCSELAEGDREFEGKLLGFVIGSHGWIGLYAPIISGYLSDPVKQFPNSWLSTTFHGFLSKYPFVLPNIASAIFTSIALAAAFFFIPETNPLGARNIGPKPTMKAVWAKPATRDHLISMWIFSFVAFFAAESVPLFFVATDGGLSLKENTIGTFFTVVGVFYLVFQFISYEKVRERVGVYGAMRLGSALSLPAIVLLPISLVLNRGQPPNTLNAVTFTYLLILMGTRRIFGAIYFSTITLAANRSVERTEISVMNGLSMIGSSLVSAFSPALSGLLISFSLSSRYFSPEVGIYSYFGIVSLMAAGASAFVFIRLRKHHADS